jgi:TrmH family RNA methyltransferase
MSDEVVARLRTVNSRENALVKELRRAFTRGELTGDGHCAIESVRTIEEAIRSGLRFKAVFFSASAQPRAERLLPQLNAHTDTIVLPDDVFRSAVATESPQGVAALVRLNSFTLEDVLAALAPFLVGVAGVQDPGNLGTIIRSAEAFGASAVLLGSGTVSAYNPKVVRAAAGSLFRMPVLHELPAEHLRERGLRLIATSSHKAVSLTDADLRGPICLLIGNEGAGLSREFLSAADQRVAIPHSPKVESLNAGVAASILLYEISRQRAVSAKTAHATADEP